MLHLPDDEGGVGAGLVFRLPAECWGQSPDDMRGGPDPGYVPPGVALHLPLAALLHNSLIKSWERREADPASSRNKRI